MMTLIGVVIMIMLMIMNDDVDGLSWPMSFTVAINKKENKND